MYLLFISLIFVQIVVFAQVFIAESHKNENTTQILEDHKNNDNLNVLQWKDINITLPTNTSHQVIGYYSGGDRVYLIGGKNVENEYYSLQFNKTYEGWKKHKFEKDVNIRIVQYQQSFFSSQHNIIYIKTEEYIHIYDMETEYFNENVIRLPGHLMDGCMTVYYEPNNETIEYLIIIGAKTSENNDNFYQPTTYIYKIETKTHDITWFDIGPDLIGERENFCCAVMGRYLYVIGGTYDANTRFVQQWLIDIDIAYDSETVEFNNFSNIGTLINADVANYNLPQCGHRCIINEDKQQIYVIGGITEEEGLYFNYSRYVFVLERINDSLYEMNYRETQEEEQEMEKFKDIHYGKILPSLPLEMAYTSPLIDKYGYLHIFGGEIYSGGAVSKGTNKWLRINTNNNGNYDGDETSQTDIFEPTKGDETSSTRPANVSGQTITTKEKDIAASIEDNDMLSSDQNSKENEGLIIAVGILLLVIAALIVLLILLYKYLKCIPRYKFAKIIEFAKILDKDNENNVGRNNSAHINQSEQYKRVNSKHTVDGERASNCTDNGLDLMRDYVEKGVLTQTNTSSN